MRIEKGGPIKCMDCGKTIGYIEDYGIKTYGADYPDLGAEILCRQCVIDFDGFGVVVDHDDRVIRSSASKVNEAEYLVHTFTDGRIPKGVLQSSNTKVNEE